MADKLGILAGGGDLPRLIIEACRKNNRDFHVFALEGQTDPETVEGVPHDWFRLGAAGSALKRALELEIKDVVLAGRVTRPSLSSIRPDWKTMAFLVRMSGKVRGDDSLLRKIVEGIENEGFNVVGANSLLADLSPEAGILGQHEPDDDARADIERGLEVLRAMSAADVGQAVVVQQAIVLGVEAIEGTDALIARCADLRRDGPGGVLVKMAKVGQEKRADLPTIGPETVQRAVAAGLRGIAVGADASIILRRDEVVRAADEAGLFLIALEAD